VIGAEGNMPYAAARVHARHGRRLAESQWRRIETSRQLGEYLQLARSTALAPWVASLEPTHDAHAIERTLRSEWRRYVRAVARWHPREWQAWIDWWSWLPLLPLIACLARPEPVPPWMLADPVCGPIALGNPEQRAQALQATELAPLAPAVRAGLPIGSAWQQQAARLMPGVDQESGARLGLLVRLGPAAGAESAPGAAAALVRLFRAAAETAIASGCHLALLGLEIERLRGGLIVRCLLPATGSGAA